MIDKATYNSLAAQLEIDLNRHSRIDWRTYRYNEMLGDACISDEGARGLNTTPDAHFEFVYGRMVTRFRVQVENETLWIELPIARVLVEDALLNHVDIIRQLAADAIASKLTERGIV